MNYDEIFMRFPTPQIEATFLSRPQRFLAEIAFPDGVQTLAYCANSGSFSGCLLSGSPALLWDSANPKRKRRYTLRAVKNNGVWVGTDTHLANRIIEEALKQQLIEGFDCYETIEREHSTKEGVCVDFLLSNSEDVCYLEVKSATVVENGVARFPNSITPRGVKHLDFLTCKVKEGYRAVLLFVIQRDDVESFAMNESYYPEYTKAFNRAVKEGVEIMAIAIPVHTKGFERPIMLPVSTNIYS